MRRRSLLLGALSLCAPGTARAYEIPARLRDDMEDWVVRTAAKAALDEEALRTLLLKVEFQPGVISAFNAPATARPWSEFRAGFLTRARIDAGVRFWNTHEAWLGRARERFGVPEQLVVAILGVETFYGRNTGTFRVLDALATLAFTAPRRAAFFQDELEAFVLMCGELRVDALQVRGSYAGAMGVPQFLPSSVRAYAVDFDGDGRVDLWNGAVDAVGSVASYMNRFGWRVTGDVVLRAAARDPALAEPLVRQGIRPAFGMAELTAAGIVPERRLRDGEFAAVLLYEGESGPEYWLGLENFWVITRYNRSQNYALAAWQLGERIAAAKGPVRTGRSR